MMHDENEKFHRRKRNHKKNQTEIPELKTIMIELRNQYRASTTQFIILKG